MAWNGLAPYTGALQYFDDAGVAIGDIRGGELAIDPNVQIEGAIGGQASSQGGIIATTVRVDLLEPVKAYLTGIPRATASTASTAYDFECGTTDGDYNLTKVQAAGFSYEVSNDRPIPRVSIDYWAAKVAEAATGSAQAASAGLTDCFSDFSITIDALDYLCTRFAISMRANPRWFRAFGAKGSGNKRFPDIVLLGQEQWALSLDLAKKIPVASSSLLADSIDQDIDVIITGAGITFTLSGLQTPRERGPFQGAGDLVLWTYDFNSLPGFGHGAIG